MAVLVMGPMGYYQCKADGLRKEPEVHFQMVTLLMLTIIYVQGCGGNKNKIKATLYYLATVLCIKTAFFFDNNSVSSIPVPQ